MPKARPVPQAADICNIPCFDHARVDAIKSALADKEERLPALAGFYKLLGNANRLRILMALGEGELCVCDIAHVLGLSMAATSHQLKLLREQGWLGMRNDGKMVYYRLDNPALLEAIKGDLSMLRGRDE